MSLQVAEFVFVEGSLSLEKTTLASVTVRDGDTSEVLRNASLLSIGAANVNAFVGVNGPATIDDGSGNSVHNTEAIGFTTQVETFALALIKPKPATPADPPTDPPVAPTDRRSWMALEANVREAAFIGLGDLFTAKATQLRVSLNQGTGTQADGSPNTSVVDFTQTDRNGDGPDGMLTVSVGPGIDHQITVAGPEIKASGTLEIAVAGFFFVNGNFAFEKSTLANLKVTDGITEENIANASLLTIGASDVPAFVGVNGPAQIADENNNLVDNPNALGFAVTVDYLALALVKPPASEATSAVDGRSWMALDVGASQPRFLGLGEDFTLNVGSLALSINRGSGTTATGAENKTVVDFTSIDRDGDGQPDGKLTIATGPESTRDLTSRQEETRASGQRARINLLDFVSGTADFAFEKVNANVDVTGGKDTRDPDNLQNAPLTVFVLHNASLFVGADADPANPGRAGPNSVGLEVTGAQLAVAVVKAPVTDEGSALRFTLIPCPIRTACVSAVRWIGKRWLRYSSCQCRAQSQPSEWSARNNAADACPATGLDLGFGSGP